MSEMTSVMPLTRWTVGRAKDRAQAQQLLAKHFTTHRLTAAATALDYHLTKLPGDDGNQSLLAMRYGAAVTLEAEVRDIFAVLVPAYGGLVVTIDKIHTITAPPAAGAIISPPCQLSLRLSQDCVLVIFRIARTALEQSAPSPVRFIPELEPAWRDMLMKSIAAVDQ